MILSTNIAESSITVPDIKYVIDFCLTKNLVCDPDTNYTSLQMEWASKANSNQRKGMKCNQHKGIKCLGSHRPGKAVKLVQWLNCMAATQETWVQTPAVAVSKYLIIF